MHIIKTDMPFLHALSLLVLGTMVIILFAQITIPLPKIPITGQSLAILVVACILKGTIGTGAVILYLLLGMLGFPVFADGASGMDKLAGPSGGYLYGFVPAALLAGWMASMKNTWDWNMLIMTIGTLIILLFGVSHLAYHLGFSKALEYGLYPFIPGAIIKIFLGTGIVALFYFLWDQFAPK